MDSRLDVYLYGVPVAELERLAPERYRMRYRDEWFDDPAAMPVSLSLPLGPRPHEGDVLTAFLDNLLPDNAEVRERWAVEAGLATDEPFFLLAEYGEDVAGAIQFARPGIDPNRAGSRAPVSETQVADRIAEIRRDDSLWRSRESETGYFSLGGAQGKFSLGNIGEGWYEPSGVHPTTHIFKPRVQGLSDGELIEYLTMTAASFAGLPTAEVEIGEFAGEHALVVRRFDRVSGADGSIIRLHQEDLAQSLGRTRLQKYESRGGPGYREILRMLGEHVPEGRRIRARARFVQALVFSWMMLNTDAHAKNYSVFIGPDGVDLAPLYDVSSLIPYLGREGDDQRALGAALHRTKLSMRIAADYEAGQQSWFQWKAVAREAGLDREDLTDWARGVAEGMPELIAALAATLPSHLQTDTVARFVELLPIRSGQIVRAVDE